ncbi:MAG: DUF1501 domain-containing protein, partial [Acidobacteria bacterium]|nr:DUF1501 domain-containing protein [Acidobacteriota bacterium]
MALTHEAIELTRRRFLQDSALGLTGIALTSLLQREVSGAPRALHDLQHPADHLLHHPARAKQVLQIFCPGAASHLDLWDYKPALEKYDGTPLPGGEKEVTFQGKNGNLMKSPWPFVAAGSSGKRISSLLPRMAAHVDDIAFIHSMTSRSNTHGPASVFMNTGSVREGFPAAGAWVGYALGSLNDNLPTFVAITDVRGEPPNGKANWASGFLPAQHQAVMLAAHQPLRNLSRPDGISAAEDLATRDFLQRLNQDNGARHPGESDLTARTASY